MRPPPAAPSSWPISAAASARSGASSSRRRALRPTNSQELKQCVGEGPVVGRTKVRDLADVIVPGQVQRGRLCAVALGQPLDQQGGLVAKRLGIELGVG